MNIPAHETGTKRLQVLRDTLGNVRAEIEKKQAAIEELEDGMRPLEKALEEVNTTVDLMAAELHETAHHLANPGYRGVAVPLDGVYEGAHEAAMKSSVMALVCRMFPERLKEIWSEDVRAYYDASSRVIHDPKKVGKLRAELHALEVQEERLICEADEMGVEIPRRIGVDPAIVLGL